MTPLSATPLSVGQSVTANIMDSKDVDWYRLNAIGKSLTVSLDNRSATLRPSVSAFDSNRSQVDSQHYDSTPGANLKFVLSTDPGTSYYLKVEGFSESTGAYSLLTQ
jgi:hypothetical protein